MSKEKMQERDDIDRLMEINEQEIPPPGKAFEETLQKLRQMQPNARLRPARNRFGLAGLGAAAVLAIGLLTVAILALSNKSNSPTFTPVVANQPVPTATTTSEAATATAIVAAPATTIRGTNLNNTTEPTASVTVSESTVAPSSPAPESTTAAVTTTQPVETTPAAQAPSTNTAAPSSNPPNVVSPPPPASKTPVTPGGDLTLPVVTPIVITPKPTLAPGSDPVTVSGFIINFDKNAGTIRIGSAGGTVVTVKIMANTVINRNNVASSQSDIKDGDLLTVVGKVNQQNQLEATSINLGVQARTSVRPPIGYPVPPTPPDK